MKLQYTLALALLLLFTSCDKKLSKSESETDEEAMKELLEGEMENQDRALHGNKDPKVQMIRDKDEVEKIRKDVRTKIENAHSKKSSEPVDEYLELAKRFWKHDNTASKLIVEKFNAPDVEVRDKMIAALDDYTLRNHAVIIDPDVSKAILKCLDNPALEKDAIQLAGICKVPGHTKKFGVMLLNGNSVDEGRLVYWLGEDGTNMNVLNVTGKRLLNNEFKEDDLVWVVSGIQSYAENGNADIRHQANNIAKQYIEKFGFDNKYSDEMVEILCMNPEAAFLPILEKAYDKEIAKYDVLIALITLQKEKYKDEVLRNFKSDFFENLRAVEALGKKSKDDELIRNVLVTFGKQKDVYEGEIMQLILTLQAIHGEEYILKADEFIDDKKLVNDLHAVYKLTNMSVEEIATDLLNIGILDKPVSPEIIQTLKDKPWDYDHYTSMIQYILEEMHVYHYFDAETGFIPVDYDTLLTELTVQKNGLSELLIWMDAEIIEIEKNGTQNGIIVGNSATTSYKITVVDTDKVFILTPEDMGDWYDVQSVVFLLNKILENKGREERYFLLETGDQMAQIIYGKAATVKRFRDKYRF